MDNELVPSVDKGLEQPRFVYTDLKEGISVKPTFHSHAKYGEQERRAGTHLQRKSCEMSQSLLYKDQEQAKLYYAASTTFRIPLPKLESQILHWFSTHKGQFPKEHITLSNLRRKDLPDAK